MDLTVVTEPTETCIDLSLVKANSRILHSAEDALIRFLIEAAEDFISREANISIMQRTLQLRVDGQNDVVSLPRPPLIDITSVEFVDEDEVATALTLTDLPVRKCSMMSTVHFDDVDYENKGGTVIEYTAGYAAADQVPPALRRGVLMLASHWYTSREAAFMDARIMDIEKQIPFGVDQIIDQFRVSNTQSGLVERGGISFR